MITCSPIFTEEAVAGQSPSPVILNLVIPNPVTQNLDGPIPTHQNLAIRSHQTHLNLVIQTRVPNYLDLATRSPVDLNRLSLVIPNRQIPNHLNLSHLNLSRPNLSRPNRPLGPREM
jgi:hypothetical protein